MNEEKSADTIVIDLKNSIKSRGYKVRKAGRKSGSFEATIPLDVYKREARRRDLTSDELMDQYEAVWHYGDFEGLYLSFEPTEGGQR